MTYSAEVLADSPLVYWRLGDASGTTMTDSSGNSRNGTYSNSPTLGVTGALAGSSDTAVSFSGAGSQAAFIAYAAWMSQSSFTLEAWVKGTGTGQVIFGRAGTTTVGYLGVDASGKLFIQSRNSLPQNQNRTGLTTINDGQWHHVVGVRDGNDLHVYVDGVLDDGTTTGGSAPVASDTTNSLNVASRGGGSPALYAGAIDECAYYGAALTATRIAAHYAAGTNTGQTVTPPAATATATARPPAVSASASVTAVAATATATALAPSVSASVPVTAAPATATATALAPTVTADATIQAVPATATAAGVAPSIVADSAANIQAVPATATATVLPPTISVGVTISAPAATATADALPPTVTALAGGDATVLAAIATATAAVLAPTVSASATIAAAPATATAAALAPTVVQVFPAATDTSNLLNGRDRRGSGTATVARPVAAPPDTLGLALQYDKALALPVPDLVNGRPT